MQTYMVEIVRYDGRKLYASFTGPVAKAKARKFYSYAAAEATALKVEIEGGRDIAQVQIIEVN